MKFKVHTGPGQFYYPSMGNVYYEGYIDLNISTDHTQEDIDRYFTEKADALDYCQKNRILVFRDVIYFVNEKDMTEFLLHLS